MAKYVEHLSDVGTESDKEKQESDECEYEANSWLVRACVAELLYV